MQIHACAKWINEYVNFAMNFQDYPRFLSLATEKQKEPVIFDVQQYKRMHDITIQWNFVITSEFVYLFGIFGN